MSESATRLAWKPQLRTTEPRRTPLFGSGVLPVEFGRTNCAPGEKVALKPGSWRGVPRRSVESGGEVFDSDAERAFPVPRGMRETMGLGCGEGGEGRELRNSKRRVSPERRIKDCCFSEALLMLAAIEWIVSEDFVMCTVYESSCRPYSASNGRSISFQYVSALPVPEPPETIILISASSGLRCGGSFSRL